METLTLHKESKAPLKNKNPLFFKPIIQKKLSAGSANDSYEVEADQVADKVMKMSELSPQVMQTGALFQRKCAACEQEEKLRMKPLAESISPLIQRSSSESGGVAPNHVESQINSSKGEGKSMDHGTKNFMESRFGTDFSNVKIHTGSKAVQMNRELNAQAFAVGNDIYFNEGKYNPNSDSGKHLLAHELTHTVQQSGGVGRKIQKFPLNGRDEIHGELESVYSEETESPREHHSASYSSWLSRMNAFNSFRLLPGHLTDTLIIVRFQRMTLEELMTYRDNYIAENVHDPLVINYITNVMLGRTQEPCSTTDIQNTERMARAALATLPTLISNAETAVTRLHSLWINYKPNFLTRMNRLTGQVACAFRSNFNIDENNSDFGVTHIHVMNRLAQFRRRLSVPISFVCEGINNPNCLSGRGLDAEAYVVNNQSPIHLCYGFRENPFSNLQQATIVHEYMHLLPGVHDQGGYSVAGTGATSCTMHSKFGSTATSLLINSADSLAGFVMHTDQYSPRDIHVI